MTYGANQYKKTSIQSAGRGQLLLMLYEAAVKNVKKASECIDKRDIAGKGQHIIKAHDIINELLNTLDFNVGGEIARELERLYNFMTDHLVKANVENSKDKLRVVEKLLSTLLDGWRGAVAQTQGGKAPGNSTPQK